MKICIGIISYLPEANDDRGKVIRFRRIGKIVNLINQCNNIFGGIPILIVAQNWKREINLSNNCTAWLYDKPLGITGARRKLRNYFINSDFDYMIMLDDDCELVGTADNGKFYLQQLLDNPGKYGVFADTLLKLFAISKEMYKKIDYPEDIEAEKGEYLEDIYITLMLKNLYPDKEFRIVTNGLYDISDSAGDNNSTWSNDNIDRKEMGARTRKLVEEKVKELKNEQA